MFSPHSWVSPWRCIRWRWMLGRGDPSFPTIADTGVVLVLGHLLSFCKTTVLQGKALSEPTCCRQYELEQYRGVKNSWGYSSKWLCFLCTLAVTVLRKCKFGRLWQLAHLRRLFLVFLWIQTVMQSIKPCINWNRSFAQHISWLNCFDCSTFPRTNHRMFCRCKVHLNQFLMSFSPI